MMVERSTMSRATSWGRSRQPRTGQTPHHTQPGAHGRGGCQAQGLSDTRFTSADRAGRSRAGARHAWRDTALTEPPAQAWRVSWTPAHEQQECDPQDPKGRLYTKYWAPAKAPAPQGTTLSVRPSFACLPAGARRSPPGPRAAASPLESRTVHRNGTTDMGLPAAPRAIGTAQSHRAARPRATFAHRAASGPIPPPLLPARNEGPQVEAEPSPAPGRCAGPAPPRACAGTGRPGRR